jgi:hypothetical protein
MYVSGMVFYFAISQPPTPKADAKGHRLNGGGRGP